MDLAKKTFPKQEQDVHPGKEYKMKPKPRTVDPNYRGSGKLSGKVALITGGDSGIGRAVAIFFAKEGANVAISYLNENKDALDTKELVEKEGAKCVLLPGDITDEAHCKDLVDQTIKELGKITTLINNAAVQFPKENFEDIKSSDLDLTFKTNIYSYFYLTKYSLPHFPKDGAVIINTTSVTAYRGSKHLVDYSATKGAIVSFTRSLALMLAPRNIRVNGVAPGPIWTPLIPSSFDETKVETFGSDVPLGRAGQPEEIAPSYVFLASDDASYITGQILHPNGGEIING